MAKNISIPYSGGTKSFSYSIDCTNNVSFSYNSEDWFTVTQDVSTKKVTISASTNTNPTERIFEITPNVDGDFCLRKNIVVVQDEHPCDCSSFKVLDSNLDPAPASGETFVVLAYLPSSSVTTCLSDFGVWDIYDASTSYPNWILEDDIDFEDIQSGDTRVTRVTGYIGRNDTGLARTAYICYSAKTDNATCTNACSSIDQVGVDCDCSTLKLETSSCLIWDADEYSVSNTGITVDIIINSGSCHSNIVASVTEGFSMTHVGNRIRIAPTNANTSSTPLSGTLEVSYDYNGSPCTKKTMPMYQFSSKKYMRFEPSTTCTFQTNVTASTTYYSDDCGVTWKTLTPNTPIRVQPCNPILLKATGTTYRGIPATTYETGKPAFKTTGLFTIKGNIMSMLYGDDFESKTTLTANGAFDSIFANSSVYDASELILPATTLTKECYKDMFAGCNYLTKVPSDLPATTLAEECYENMFSFCTDLDNVPNNYLPATTLAYGCYWGMFAACTSLKSLPTLPATELKALCYCNMFISCSKITTIPNGYLPTTSLVEHCYDGMFSYCKSLTTVPSNLLPATTLADYCYRNMFTTCTSLTTAPDLPATRLVNQCYGWMFEDCTNLNYVKCLATNISATDCTYRWLRNVSSSGTFVKNSSTSWTSGENGIPDGWTIQNA